MAETTEQTPASETPEAVAANRQDLALRAAEIAELWKMGAETAVIDDRLRNLREVAAGHLDQEMRLLAGDPATAAEHRRSYEQMLDGINEVLADIADGDAIGWYAMFETINRMLADQAVEVGAGPLPLPLASAADDADAVIAWGKELTLGEGWLDHHHRGMVELLKALEGLPAPPHCDPEEVDGLLESLRRSAWHHFHEEEARMQRGRDAALHVAEHRALLRQLDGVILDVRARRFVLTAAARRKLRGWLVHHIDTRDRHDFGPLNPHPDMD